MKYRFFTVLCLILFVFASIEVCFASASPVINISFNQTLWEKGEELGSLITAYNDKENVKTNSKVIKLHGSNKKGIKYRTNVNTSSGETQIYIYKGGNLVIKMHGNKSNLALNAPSLSRNDTLSSRTLSSRAGSIIQTAKRYLGMPYRWGGVGSGGFDCSGFTMKIFQINGVNILRCADEQYSQGYYVSPSEMLPGDLVFFSTYAPGASHVGIYLGGDKFIHASSRYGVTISSLNDAYYNSCFIGARRMWQ